MKMAVVWVVASCSLVEDYFEDNIAHMKEEQHSV
jgi:hypothetical protein